MFMRSGKALAPIIKASMAGAILLALVAGCGGSSGDEAAGGAITLANSATTS
jgi:hypothetical protein